MGARHWPIRFTARAGGIQLSYLITMIVIGLSLRDLWRRPVTSLSRRVLWTLAVVSIGGAAGYSAPIGALAYLLVDRRPVHSSASVVEA